MENDARMADIAMAQEQFRAQIQAECESGREFIDAGEIRTDSGTFTIRIPCRSTERPSDPAETGKGADE